MRNVIVATIVIGFFAWLSQLFTTKHQDGPVYGRTLTVPPLMWNGQIAIHHRSDPVQVLNW